MTHDELWDRYSRIWMLEGERRDTEMAACLAPDVTYTDPQATVSGYKAFADYMAGFRQAMPGRSFRIKAVKAHHDRTLARWDMVDANGTFVSPGISFGLLTADGKLQAISGFFGGVEVLFE